MWMDVELDVNRVHDTDDPLLWISRWESLILVLMYMVYILIMK